MSGAEAAGPWTRLDAEAVAAYAELTQDFNPIHLDPDFAAKTPLGRPIVHGTLTLSLVWPLVAPGAALELRFVKPVFVGEEVRARRIETGVEVENRAGETVLAVTWGEA